MLYLNQNLITSHSIEYAGVQDVEYLAEVRKLILSLNI